MTVVVCLALLALAVLVITDDGPHYPGGGL